MLELVQRAAHHELIMTNQARAIAMLVLPVASSPQECTAGMIEGTAGAHEAEKRERLILWPARSPPATRETHDPKGRPGKDDAPT